MGTEITREHRDRQTILNNAAKKPVVADCGHETACRSPHYRITSKHGYSPTRIRICCRCWVGKEPGTAFKRSGKDNKTGVQLAHKSAYFALALAAGLAMSQPARADEIARDGNVMLFAQLGDAVSTHFDLALPNRYESDPLARPLARPFVHSVAASAGVAVGVNLLARAVFRHSPRVLRYFGGVEVEYTGRNVFNMFRPHEVWGKQ